MPEIEMIKSTEHIKGNHYVSFIGVFTFMYRDKADPHILYPLIEDIDFVVV